MQLERVLRKLKRIIKERTIYGFDIETYGDKNDFLMGSIVGDNFKRTFWNKEEMIECFFKDRRFEGNVYIIATNLYFDFMNLLKDTKHLENVDILERNSNIIYAKLLKNKNNVKFIDTFSFCNLSVKAMGEIINIPKLEQPSFLGKIPKTLEQKKELEKYNLRDCEITFKFMVMLQKGFNDLGANLRITLPATAMDLFRRRFMKFNYFQPKKWCLDYLFNGYYGGRVEVIKRGRVENLNIYDINSLYPFVMKREYPNPNHIKYSRYITKKTILDYEGLVRVKLKTPKMYIPYLPLRFGDKEYNTKLIFPVGSFVGYYTFFELRKALELGYDIKTFYNGVIYFKTFTPFKDYISKLYKNRMKHKKQHSPLEMIDKIAMNSLYGKFAQKIKEKSFIKHQSQVTYEMIKRCDYVERKGNFFIMKMSGDNKNFRIPRFVNPIFSIYTTAYARDELFNRMKKIRRDDLYYYDTDSLITSKHLDTSDKLGDLKLEFKIKEGILVKPKMYFCSDGIFDKIKVKGCRTAVTNRYQFLKLLSNPEVTLRKFTKFRESIRRNFSYNQVLEFQKHIDLEDNKRNWGDNDFNVNELQDSLPLSVDL